MTTIAYTCPFVPPEWIAAHGLGPRRIVPSLGGPDDPVGALPGLCTYARAFVNTALRAPRPDAVVFTTVCDQMRRALELLAGHAEPTTFLLNVPATWHEAAARLYETELERLGRFLVELGGTAPSPEKLARTMQEFERRRLAERLAVCPAGAVPLAIVGGPILAEHHELRDLVAGFGGHIALDATPGGELTAPAAFDPAAMADDPLRELARAYFGHIPHAMRRPNTGLYEWLSERLSARGVRGVLFYRHLWCDLWHAEFARVRDAFGVPVLEIDVGDDLALARQTGRIQAFMEALR